MTLPIRAITRMTPLRRKSRECRMVAQYASGNARAWDCQYVFNAHAPSALMGYYSMVAMTLLAYDMPVAADAPVRKLAPRRTRG